VRDTCLTGAQWRQKARNENKEKRVNAGVGKAYHRDARSPPMIRSGLESFQSGFPPGKFLERK
jgi:hypothetical protein